MIPPPAALAFPIIVGYLLAGFAAGPHGFHWLHIPQASVGSQLIWVLGAAFILYEGGREIDLSLFRQVWISLTLLATVGVVATAAVVAAAGVWLASLPLSQALLLAAILAPTDPAAIIPLFRHVRIRRRLAQTVLAESALNDATGAVLATAVVSAMQGGPIGWHESVWQLLRSILVGVGVGIAVSTVALFLLRGSARWPALLTRDEHETIASLATVLAAYLGAEALGGSGFMATFTAGVVHGNPAWADPSAPHRHDLSVGSILLRMAIFVLLGSRVDLAELKHHAWPAVALTLALILIARPIAVLLSTLPDRRARWNGREIAFFCWVRETGVVAAALAGLLAERGGVSAGLAESTVFLAAVVTLVVQAGTTGRVARWLRVLEDGERV